ncbi:hypothetical protein E3E38_04895 [Thermococcus sp. 18S1]|uniref:hypothetical protein n=1 Tax=Thermococcus sp. 18S1 TaxID=1638210 RepID=UPI00143C4457|nr:hypothetical protein [Thermococcus sp. 18S1]NJE30389.1 hypothetical protein [Thermococcus sp. 18S1]
MRRGQVSLDFLFAVTLIAITMLNIAYIANIETGHARTFDITTRLKIFSVDVRDTVVKGYSVGDGFKIKKESPIPLKSDSDSIVITLIDPGDLIKVTAVIEGKTYTTYQKSPVPIYATSSVVLKRGQEEFWIVATYNEKEGKLYVTLQASS